MEDFQMRVINEREELSIKISRLHIFLNSNAADPVSAEDKKLLAEQLSTMRDYHSILTSRILKF
jgi:hypothetical protein